MLFVGQGFDMKQRVNAGWFKKNQHWRQRKNHWDKDWLLREYVGNRRSAADIANEMDCKENNILYWLAKHGIARRSMSEVRATKYWGVSGKSNPMYGATGRQNPNWKGGATPERQGFYSSSEWDIACSAVWKRDDANCQRCLTSWRESKLNVHHIAPFSVVALRATLSNLVLLCVGCHRFVHSRQNVNHDFIKRKEVQQYGG